MNGRIPEWFTNQRERVWEELSQYIGKGIPDERTTKEIETKVNDLIDEFERGGKPLTHNGRIINGCRITNRNGRFSIQLV